MIELVTTYMLRLHSSISYIILAMIIYMTTCMLGLVTFTLELT